MKRHFLILASGLVFGFAQFGCSGTSAGGSGTGGSSSTGGSTATGGSTSTGGSSAGTGGALTGSGGSEAPGSGGREGGMSGSGGGGGGGSTGSGGRGGSGAGGSGTGGGNAVTTKFSFFVTSQSAMAALSGSADGFGGDLRHGETGTGAGLKGADKICTEIAERSMPGNAKTWRAFLSVASGPAGGPENAIDRVGSGPWYDRKGRTVAMTKADLLCSRPCNSDAVIRDDLPNEDGVPNHNPGTGIIDNHNTMTGSGANGQLHPDGAPATCQDWTSPAKGQGFLGSGPAIGFSWPAGTGNSWSFVIRDGGCAPGVTPGGGAQGGPSGTVGALGGYGGIYCFALQP